MREIAIGISIWQPRLKKLFLELLSKFPYSVGLIVHLKTQPVLPAFLFLSSMVYLLGWLSSSAILL